MSEIGTISSASSLGATPNQGTPPSLAPRTPVGISNDPGSIQSLSPNTSEAEALPEISCCRRFFNRLMTPIFWIVGCFMRCFGKGKLNQKNLDAEAKSLKGSTILDTKRLKGDTGGEILISALPDETTQDLIRSFLLKCSKLSITNFITDSSLQGTLKKEGSEICPKRVNPFVYLAFTLENDTLRSWVQEILKKDERIVENFLATLYSNLNYAYGKDLEAGKNTAKDAAVTYPKDGMLLYLPGIALFLDIEAQVLEKLIKQDDPEKTNKKWKALFEFIIKARDGKAIGKVNPKEIPKLNSQITGAFSNLMAAYTLKGEKADEDINAALAGIPTIYHPLAVLQHLLTDAELFKNIEQLLPGGAFQGRYLATGMSRLISSWPFFIQSLSGKLQKMVEKKGNTPSKEQIELIKKCIEKECGVLPKEAEEFKWGTPSNTNTLDWENLLKALFKAKSEKLKKLL